MTKAKHAPGAMPPRASPSEIERRVARVRDLMLAGEWSTQVAKDMAKELGVSDRTVREYAKDASAPVIEALGGVDTIRAGLWGKLEAAYETALARRDARSMVLAVQQQARLFGVEAPRRVDITTTAEGIPAYMMVLAHVPGGVEWFAGLQHVPSIDEVETFTLSAGALASPDALSPTNPNRS